MFTCDICNKEVRGNDDGSTVSIDVVMSLTTYGSDGEVIGTLDEPNESLTLGHGYVNVCTDCQDRLIESWRTFLINLGVTK